MIAIGTCAKLSHFACALWYTIFMSASRPCNSPMCPRLATEGAYCDEHRRLYDDHHRAGSNARGYNYRWRKIRARVLKNNPLCADPDGVHTFPEPATEVDHIKPLRMGGTNQYDNLQSLCKSCHSRKTARENSRANEGGRGYKKLQPWRS